MSACQRQPFPPIGYGWRQAPWRLAHVQNDLVGRLSAPRIAGRTEIETTILLLVIGVVLTEIAVGTVAIDSGRRRICAPTTRPQADLSGCSPPIGS